MNKRTQQILSRLTNSRFPERRGNGFTIVELMIVVSLFAIMFAFTQVNLSGLILDANLQEQTQAILSDLRRQQQEAMNGVSDGTGILQPRGVYFGDTSYWLFSGTEFNPATAYEVKLVETIRFSLVSFPQRLLLFEPLSGEVMLYGSGQNEVEIQNTASGERVLVEINQLGVPVIQ